MKKIDHIQDWLELSNHGKFLEAQDLYNSKILPNVIELFASKYSQVLNEDELLISILGFSPEPIILTAFAMKPKKHLILSTGKNLKAESTLSNYLKESYELIRVTNESFSSIYASLKEQMKKHSYSKIVIDITGGKKSMVASAAIFAKDKACKLVYVDFAEYLQELRKPKPGTEILNLVYDPNRD
jgi:hypothetical protein